MRKDAPQLDRFADEFCFDFIEKAVSTYIVENFNKLECTSKIQPEGAQLEDLRIEFTMNAKTYGNVIGFDAVVSADIEIYETIRGEDKSDLVTQWFRVPCQIIFEEKILNKRINDGKGGGIEIYSKTSKFKSNVAATNDLVPIIYGENYDAEATRFLKKYCPDALKTPMPIPLDEIVEAMGLPPINYEKHLSPDFSIYGKICFADEKIDVYNTWGIPEKIQAKRGQIFIDNDTYILCNVGCLRNTVAHELFHWERHRLYATIKRLLDVPDFKSTRCRVRTQGANKQKSEELTDEEWMELHANAISPRIIMPIETAKLKAIEILKKNKYSFKRQDSEAVLRASIIELANFFQVSKQLATIRLAQLGVKQAQEIFDKDYDRNILCASQVPHSDIIREYKDNISFREAIESDYFRYAEGRFIINDPKYLIKLDGGIYILTDYAREHLDECALRFETVELKTGDCRGDGLYRKNKSGVPLIKKYVVDAITIATAEAQLKASDEFYKEAERHRRYLSAIGSGTCFSESFNALMFTHFEPLGIQPHKYGAKVLELTGISDKVYRDMRNGDANYCPSHRTIVALCAGFDFEISIAENLLQKGGKCFSNTNEHLAFRLVLTAYRGYEIEERSDYLEAMGHGRLTDC